MKCNNEILKSLLSNKLITSRSLTLNIILKYGIQKIILIFTEKYSPVILVLTILELKLQKSW